MRTQSTSSLAVLRCLSCQSLATSPRTDCWPWLGCPFVTGCASPSLGGPGRAGTIRLWATLTGPYTPVRYRVLIRWTEPNGEGGEEGEGPALFQKLT